MLQYNTFCRFWRFRLILLLGHQVQALEENRRQQVRTLAFSIVLLVMAAGVATAQQVQQLDLRLYPQADGVNVRSTPSMSATVLGQVNKGDAINITGLVGDWYRVDHPPGRTGYILKALLAAQPPAGPQVAAGTPPRNAGDVFQDCGGCPEMVVVPAGKFTMGSPANEAGRTLYEGPQHGVTIGRSFAVGKFEVTFAEWDACVSGGGCSGYSPNDWGWGRGRQPVMNVSWDDAKAYVSWLSQRTSQQYRLLSEAEWEYVARAGTTTRYWWGNDIGRTNANCDGCGTQSNGKKTSPVGTFAANAFGLHDVHGNVFEWVEDCRHDTYAGAPVDGTAWTAACSDASRVLRGGSWNNIPAGVRSADRIWTWPGRRQGTDLGLRVARTL